MAVGPFDPDAFWVTGWTGVARCLAWLASCGRTILDDAPLYTLLDSWRADNESAIAISGALHSNVFSATCAIGEFAGYDRCVRPICRIDDASFPSVVRLAKPKLQPVHMWCSDLRAPKVLSYLVAPEPITERLIAVTPT